MEENDRDLFWLDLLSFPYSQNQNPSSSSLSFIFVPLPNELDLSTLSPMAKDKKIQSVTCPL